MEPTGIAAILAIITQVVTAAISWVGSYIGCVMASGNELLAVFFCLPLVGLGIGLLRRLAQGT